MQKVQLRLEESCKEKVLSQLGHKDLQQVTYEKKQPSGMGLSFCAFQIFDGKGTEVSNLQQLVKWGFHVCGHIKVTKDVVSKVKQLHSQWQDSLIFSRYPTDGIVIKF